MCGQMAEFNRNAYIFSNTLYSGPNLFVRSSLCRVANNLHNKGSQETHRQIP